MQQGLQLRKCDTQSQSSENRLVKNNERNKAAGDQDYKHFHSSTKYLSQYNACISIVFFVFVSDKINAVARRIQGEETDLVFR